jgi:hypothetical protein
LNDFWRLMPLSAISQLCHGDQHKGQQKKEQKDKQRSTKHTYKTKDRATRTLLKTEGGKAFVLSVLLT